MSETVKETQGAAGGAAQARAESVGSLRRDPALRARGPRLHPPGVGDVLPLVGHLHARATASARSAARAARASRRRTSWCASASPTARWPRTRLRAIADLAERHARGVADLTVRQNVQLHWVTIEDLPTVLETLWRTGITTLGACGDVTRNVTGCPVAGRGRRRAGRRLAARARGHAHAQRQPRLLQPAAQVQDHDHRLPRLVRLSRDQRRRADRRAPPAAPGEVGFSVRVGGGLSTEPHLAVAPRRLRAAGAQVLAGRRGRVGDLPRQRRAAREPREGAAEVPLPRTTAGRRRASRPSWSGASASRWRRRCPRSRPDDVYRDHVGIHRAAAGRARLRRPAVLRGRLTPDQLRAIAAAGRALRLGRGPHHDDAERDRARRAARPRARRSPPRPRRSAFALEASPFRRGTVACTGSEFCKLALTETKGFARWLVERPRDAAARLRSARAASTSPAARTRCGQHWIADIGIEGKKLKVDGALVDAYYFCVGGAVGRHADGGAARRLSRRRPTRCRRRSSGCSGATSTTARPGEPFRGFCARHTDEELREILAGGLVAAVERDVPAGRPPHGVEG